MAPQVTFPLVFDAVEFCTPELQAELKAPRIAGAPGCALLCVSLPPAGGLPFNGRPLLAFALRSWAQGAAGQVPSQPACCAYDQSFLLAVLLCLYAAAKEVEDRKAGLNKKQKLSEEAAAGSAPAAGAAAGGDAAAAPAGGEVEMKEAEGSSSAVAQAQEDPSAFAGQLTGGWLGSGWGWFAGLWAMHGTVAWPFCPRSSWPNDALPVLGTADWCPEAS